FAGGDGVFTDGGVVARPAAAGVELGVGVEQGRVAAHAVVLARLTLEVIGAGKWPFGPLESANLILGVIQLGAPGVVRLDYFVHISSARLCVRARSEERRVGKECRSRSAAYYFRKMLKHSVIHVSKEYMLAA